MTSWHETAKENERLLVETVRELEQERHAHARTAGAYMRFRRQVRVGVVALGMVAFALVSVVAARADPWTPGGEYTTNRTGQVYAGTSITVVGNVDTNYLLVFLDRTGRRVGAVNLTLPMLTNAVSNAFYYAGISGSSATTATNAAAAAQAAAAEAAATVGASGTVWRIEWTALAEVAKTNLQAYVDARDAICLTNFQAAVDVALTNKDAALAWLVAQNAIAQTNYQGAVAVVLTNFQAAVDVALTNWGAAVALLSDRITASTNGMTSIVYTLPSEYATAAQGLKADAARTNAMDLAAQAAGATNAAHVAATDPHGDRAYLDGLMATGTAARATYADTATSADSAYSAVTVTGPMDSDVDFGGRSSTNILGITFRDTIPSQEQFITVKVKGTTLIYTKAGDSTSHFIWTQDKQGSGTGMDADLLDGYHAGSFALAMDLLNYVPTNRTITVNGTIGTLSSNLNFTIASGIPWVPFPSATNSVGNAGDMAYTNNYLGVCVGPNNWKRTPLSGW